MGKIDNITSPRAYILVTQTNNKQAINIILAIGKNYEEENK